MLASRKQFKQASQPATTRQQPCSHRPLRPTMHSAPPSQLGVEKRGCCTRPTFLGLALGVLVLGLLLLLVQFIDVLAQSRRRERQQRRYASAPAASEGTAADAGAAAAGGVQYRQAVKHLSPRAIPVGRTVALYAGHGTDDLGVTFRLKRPEQDRVVVDSVRDEVRAAAGISVGERVESLAGVSLRLDSLGGGGDGGAETTEAADLAATLRKAQALAREKQGSDPPRPVLLVLAPPAVGSSSSAPP